MPVAQSESTSKPNFCQRRGREADMDCYAINLVEYQIMKLTKKNTGAFLLILFLGLMIGTLSWEVLERIIGLFGREISLAVGPIGIDINVISLYIKINPGSFLGVLAGLLLFSRI